MRIIKGRGRSRSVVMDMPHATIVNRSAVSEQTAFRDILCGILGVAFKEEPMVATEHLTVKA